MKGLNDKRTLLSVGVIFLQVLVQDMTLNKSGELLL